MIVTCTLNPSLDCYMEFEDNLELGKTNRSLLEYYEAGGKGINVSVVLNNLGVPSKAFGFLGGFAKDFYISLLTKYNQIQPSFTYIDGNTRINIKCIGDENTDLNANGPYITKENIEALKTKIERLDEGDYFVLSGNTQKYLEEDVEEMMKDLIDENVNVVLDTNHSLIQKMVKYQPFLVKRSVHELEEEYDVDDTKDVIEIGKKLYEAGAKHVIISEDDETAIFVYEGGTYRAKLVHDDVVNTVGIGDSLVAGFLMQYIRSKDALDSFKFAAACGSATAYSKTLATREKVDKFYEEVELKEIES